MAKRPKEKVTSLTEARRFAYDCFVIVGMPKSHAEIMCDVLVEADYRGLYSHGMNKLEVYLRDIKNGVINFKAIPKIIKETMSTAWVDGQNSLGPVGGRFCMNLAITKCKKSGIGWVSVKNSNHYGIASYYSSMALADGLIGMSFTNATPFLTPTRAKAAALGSNPISVAAPAANDDSFILDMATTAVAAGKIEMYRRRKQRIPPGWALNQYAQMETDPQIAFKTGRLLPLGGLEETGGAKGTGLAMLVEIFCGILAGSNYGRNIRRWGEGETYSRVADLGQCFIAINPTCFAPGFHTRLSDLMNYIRKMIPVNPQRLVSVPGDPERLHMRQVDRQGGIKYVDDLHQTLAKIADDLKVTPAFSREI